MTPPTAHPRLGGTADLAGHMVSRIGFGTMQIAERVRDETDALAILRRALEIGVDHLDTAHFYGDGTANRLIRTVLGAAAGSPPTIVTKVGAVRRSDRLVLAQRPDELRSQVEDNLTSLGVERLDVVNLRRADAPPGLVAEGEQIVALDDQLNMLLALRDAGSIGAIGLSNVDVSQLVQALPAKIACVQNVGSLLDRSAEAVHEVCRSEGIAWVPFFPLGSAFPGLPSVTEQPEVMAAAKGLGASPSQVGLAWLLAQDPHTLLIPGTASLAHLEENAAAGEVVLDEAARHALDAVAGRAAPDPAR